MKKHLQSVFVLCVCMCVCVCVSPGIIKVIDSLGSITRVGVTTVTFGRKCHSMLNPSLTTGHVLGHFSNTDAIFSQTPQDRLTQQNRMRARCGGGWGGGSRMKRERWQDGWGKEERSQRGREFRDKSERMRTE